MSNQKHNERGQFVAKSDQERQVRSIRATDTVWDTFGKMADKASITRADLLEQWVTHGGAIQASAAVAVLEEALTLKANTGGAIKAKIRTALEMLPATLD